MASRYPNDPRYGPPSDVSTQTSKQKQEVQKPKPADGKQEPPYGRRDTFDVVKSLMLKKKAPVLVEVGTLRIRDNWEGDGYSTALFSYIAKETKGELYSIDIDPNAITTSKSVIDELGLTSAKIHIEQADALEYLQKFSRKIDLLYLDAWDPAKPEEKSAERHLECFKHVERLLNPGCLVAIDDMLDLKTLRGKGELLIPYCTEKGYKTVVAGYTYLLQKP